MRFIPILLLAVISFSCTQYHVFETSFVSIKGLTEEDNAFVFENDTVRIDYYFWADRGVMSFKVFNKLSKPLYVDWKNSSFIYAGRKYDYWIDETRTSGVATSFYTTYYNGLWYQGHGINAHTFQTSKSSKPERITFLPPKSFFTKSSFHLLTSPPVVNTDSFTVETSPLRFRNYLALSLSESSNQYQFVDNEFYLSGMIRMNYKKFAKYEGSSKSFYVAVKADAAD